MLEASRFLLPCYVGAPLAKQTLVGLSGGPQLLPLNTGLILGQGPGGLRLPCKRLPQPCVCQHL